MVNPGAPGEAAGQGLVYGDSDINWSRSMSSGCANCYTVLRALSGRSQMLFRVLILALIALPVSANSLRIFTLSADEWGQPRSGTVITNFSALRAAVNYWEKGFDAGILIRYPGEDSGEIWATELRDWLVSLGIPSDYILLVAGNQAGDEIKLIVGKRSELEQ